jgi:hypothetical protein
VRVRARRPEEAASEEEVARQAVDAPDLRSLTPDTIRALQARAGNLAVARMVATLARFVDYDQTAQIIHDAITGLGTDEAAIFAALGRLNRDPAEIDRVIAAYRAKFGADLIADLEGDLSGGELQQAMFLLRRAPSAGQQAVADEAQSMVGGQMTWTPSGPGSGNTFETWASAPSEGAAPPVSTLTRINCWEMVLLAAYRAGQLTWQWIHDQYTAAVGDWFNFMVGMLSKGARIPYVAGAPAGRKPLAGDIVFMDGMAHVAMATGNVDGAGRAEIISFWPPPNTPFAPGGTIDDVKVTTIEELVDWWTANMPPAPLVELAAPPWS